MRGSVSGALPAGAHQAFFKRLAGSRDSVFGQDSRTVNHQSGRNRGKEHRKDFMDDKLIVEMTQKWIICGFSLTECSENAIIMTEIEYVVRGIHAHGRR